MSTLPTESARKSPSDNLNHRLAFYSLTAAVAGVSVLALAQPAESEVIVTKKTIPIPTSLGLTTVPISLTNNGINDFSFSLYSAPGYTSRRALRMWPLEGGAVVAQSQAHRVPSALALVRGAKIGPSAHFSNDNFASIEESQRGCSTEVSSCFHQFSGLWGGSPKNRFLGVRFLINGETHYGWIRLTVTSTGRDDVSGTITGYAYETVANKPILAGTAGTAAATAHKTNPELQSPINTQRKSGPSLGMLASGSEALPLWRREETWAH